MAESTDPDPDTLSGTTRFPGVASPRLVYFPYEITKVLSRCSDTLDFK